MAAGVTAARLTASAFLKQVSELAYSYNTGENFRSFMELSYCVLARKTAIGYPRIAALEERYDAVLAKYQRHDPDAINKMAQLSARLMRRALGDNLTYSTPLEWYDDDLLGEAYMLSETADARRGQTFTPIALADLMARMVCSDKEIESILTQGRPITVLDPCCGAGVMVTAFAKHLTSLGCKPEESMLAMLVDVDRLCTQMALVQMSLLRIPAVIIHGNSLSLEEFERGWTPAAINQLHARNGDTAYWLTVPLEDTVPRQKPPQRTLPTPTPDEPSPNVGSDLTDDIRQPVVDSPPPKAAAAKEEKTARRPDFIIQPDLF